MSSEKEKLHQLLKEARRWIHSQGPIGVFVHHNTLHFFEEKNFNAAVETVAHIKKSEPYLKHKEYLDAWKDSRIDDEDILELYPQKNEEEEKIFLSSLKNVGGFSSTPSHCSQDNNEEDFFTQLITSYLDQGFSKFPMPNQHLNFFEAVCKLLSIQISNDSFLYVKKFLTSMNPTTDQWFEIIRSELLIQSGWAGLFATLEENPHLIDYGPQKPALLDFLAVRFLLKENKFLSSPIKTEPLNNDISFQERRILHDAFEHHYYKKVMSTLKVNLLENKKHSPQSQKNTPSFQCLFCLDEREESIRRHIEDIDPYCETFGTAGFFSVDLLFQKLGKKKQVPLCPVFIQPKNIVIEKVKNDPQHRDKFQKYLSSHHRTRRFYHLYRRFWFGQILSLLTGLFISIHMIIRVVFPKKWIRLQNFLFHKIETELHFSKTSENDSVGYSLEEMANRVENIFKMTTIYQNFSKLIFVIGHGSTTTNNPFMSAYECGACGGRRGHINSQLFTQFANRLEVRKILEERGYKIPHDTFFVATVHDTTVDTFEFFNLDLVPESHHDLLNQKINVLQLAAKHNAKERIRRFVNVAQNTSPDDALEHVQLRGHALFEPRPEYGHGSNAVWIIGPRSLTKNIFLDRRSFLTSYDSSCDPDEKIITSILNGVLPVTAGISLEYYFSRVDNNLFGSGTKLPHNVTGLIGVMDGFMSDFRSGLPWQTVEIHEPMRLLTLIESTPEKINRAIQDLPYAKNLLENEWIHLGVIDIQQKEIFMYRHKTWIPLPCTLEKVVKINSWQEYYQNRSDHLTPAIRVRPC